MTRTLTRLIFVSFALVTLLCASASAAPPTFSGDAFRRVVPLAGAWSTTAEALTPAAADAADIGRWSSMHIPGKRNTAEPAKETSTWYGIDFQLPRSDARPPSTPTLAIALPPFLWAYDAYVGGERVGGSGRTGPGYDWGPFRHRAFNVPTRAIGADGVVRLRVHVQSEPGIAFRGTHTISDPRGVAIGPAEDIEQLVDLVQSHAELYTSMPLARGMPYVELGVALVFLMLFVLSPARREYGLLALAIAGGTSLSWLRSTMLNGQADVPLRYYLAVFVCGSTSLLASLLLIRRLFQLDGRLPRALTLLAAFWIALCAVLLVVGRYVPWLESATGAVVIVIVIYETIAIGRRARRKFPDARVMVAGFTVALALTGAWVIHRMIGPNVARGDAAVIADWISAVSDIAMLGTMILVLARRYRRSLDELERSFAASIRFVPLQFLQLLGRASVTEVERGDRTHRDMVVLFCDVRGFTTLAERIGPEETIAFLNRYLLAIEPAIVDGGGFINQYYGDGIMALFPTADQAVPAAVAMMQAVDAFNRQEAERGNPPIRIGVGLNAGELAMGTIGGRVRLDSGVVGDAVNTAARIEGMTKMYSARVLMGESVVGRLTNATDHALREIDRVIAKGKREALTLYELVAAETEPLREAKLTTLGDFRRGVELARSGDIAQAHSHFAACLDAHEGDAAARVWQTRCVEWLRDGLPPGHDGVTILDWK